MKFYFLTIYIDKFPVICYVDLNAKLRVNQ